MTGGTRRPPNEIPKPSAQGLRDSSLRGGTIAVSTEFLRGVVAIAYVATMARVLRPEDFGLVAIPAAIFVMLSPLGPFGLGSAVLYLLDLADETLNSIFWTTAALSTGVGLLLVAGAPLVARLYDRSELVPVTMAFGAVALMAGLGAIPSQLMLRAMRYGAHAMIELAALLVSAIGAIGAAVLGLGHWALVVSHLLLQATALGLFFAACGWRPGRPHVDRGVMPALRYGGHLTAFHLVSGLRTRVDHLLIGRFLGTTQLGAYSTTSDLLDRITTRLAAPIRGIAVGTLSQLQELPDEYRQHFRTAILWSTSIALPVVCLAALEPSLMVRGLLGPQWGEAVPIFHILTVTAAAKLIRPATGWVFHSLGQTDRQLRWGVFETAIFLVAFAIGVRWGVLGVATASAVVSVILVVPRILYCYRLAPLATRDLLAGIWRPWAAAAVTAGVWALAGPLPTLSSHAIVQLAGTLALFALIYTTTWVLIPGGWTLAVEAARASVSRPGGGHGNE